MKEISGILHFQFSIVHFHRAGFRILLYSIRMHHEVTLPSFAKINLHLEVIGKRDDGYHDLCTVFQAVSLHDSITFSQSDELTLTAGGIKIEIDSSNLILKAAEKLRDEFGIKSGAQIHLEKQIPSPGGLGGGSSNAAVTLLGLSRFWNALVEKERLSSIAADLGADVPFFLHGGTALGTGRGTDISELPDFNEKFILIVTPLVSVSTREAYARLNAPSLTNDEANRILQICRFDAESWDFRNAALKNDFEATVFESFHEIARAKKALLDLGARQALMSGSGASVFGIFDKEETRQAALKALDDKIDWRKFAVATISRDEYREALQMV